MIISHIFAAQNFDAIAPRECRPFSIHSNVCIGDLIAILACSVAGVGFFFWAIHAIRKMRRFPFNSRRDNKGETDGESERIDPYHVPSAFDSSLLVRRGVVQTPSLPERVQTRLALSEPEGDFHRQSARMSSDSYPAPDSTPMIRTPRQPPPAGGQSLNASRRSGRHGSLTRGGSRDERYGYGMKGDSMRNVSASHARGSPQHSMESGYGSYPSMNRDPMMHAF